MEELDQIIGRLEVLLDEGRAALRRVDAHACAEFADEKLALFRRLLARAPVERRRDSIGPRIEALVDGVKRNGVLLAHARGGALMVRARGPARELVPAPQAIFPLRG